MKVELHRLHNYPIVLMPIVLMPIVGTADGEADCECILKHRHGLVTDCHWLPIVLIVLQLAPIVSAADVTVKLYMKVNVFTLLRSYRPVC